MSNPRFKIRDQINSIYDVADVAEGFTYWSWKLLNICLDIFEYENLPESLPSREIESNLMLTGHCFIFPYKGELVTTVTSIYGFDKYYNPTKATYAQAVLGSRSNINIEDYAIMYNCSLRDNVLNIKSDGSLLTFIQRYARQLADIESTINIYMTNMRLTSIPVATNDNIKGSIRKFFDMLSLGKKEIVVDTPIIESFRQVDITTKHTNDTLTDLLQCRDKILEMFFRDIGVKFRNNKRANMTESEVESDNQVLLISLDDMLKQRQHDLDKNVNARYGTNIGVKINERFVVKEVVNNDPETVLEN